MLTNHIERDYLGSTACARCHEANEQWERSLHIRMTKPIAEATVVGDFPTGTRFALTAARTSSAARTASRS